jgi:DNA-directed RNA polymerase specialized sigma24 family protein
VSEKEIDQVLVERVQKGDKAAFELLVSKYHRKILRLISRLVRDPAEVEDVAANRLFIRGCTGLRSTRQRTTLRPKGGAHPPRPKQMLKKLKLSRTPTN